jgi:hypothetical protein
MLYQIYTILIIPTRLKLALLPVLIYTYNNRICQWGIASESVEKKSLFLSQEKCSKNHKKRTIVDMRRDRVY